MSKTVSLFEHSSIKLSEAPLSGFDSSYFDALSAYLEKNHTNRPLTIERKTIRAGCQVGTVFFKGLQFEILPKLLGGENVEGYRASLYRNFLAILAITKNVQVSVTEIQKLGKSANSLLEIYIELFATLLEREITLRPNRGYLNVADNLKCVRGRIDFSTNLRVNLFHKERVYCEFDEFSENNELNQLFKFVAKSLSVATRVQSNFTRLKAIVTMFSEVTDCKFTSIQAERLSTTRLNAGYAMPLALAKLFVAGFSPAPNAGASEGIGITFDMNKVFEEFIFEILKRRQDDGGFEVKSQKRSRLATAFLNLGDPEFTIANAFGTRSDIVLDFEDGTLAVIDTKYKILNLENQLTFDVSHSDVYQILAYASILSTPGLKVLPVLLYPQPAKGEKARVCRVFKTSGADQKKFVVMTVPMFEDLSSPSSRHAIADRVVGDCRLFVRNL